MPTLDDQSIPVFTYVGRLKDSRKGLDLLFDAIDILCKSEAPSPFCLWIIGGDENDVAWARASAGSRASLQGMLASSGLRFWGRIDNSSLPEFYSRSTALIVPSFREQFCIAAVEAMMCGCPVIAARVGGLQDVVIEGRTGSLFERGVATALAAVLASYIRAPLLPKWLGANALRWAREEFDSPLVHNSMEGILVDPASFACDRWLGRSEERFRRLSISDLLPRVESLLDSKVLCHTDLTSSPSFSFSVRLTNSQRVFVKHYSTRPTFLSSLHKIPFPGQPSQLPRERLTMALHLKGQPFMPAILAWDLDSGLIIQAYAEACTGLSFAELRTCMRDILARLQSFDPGPTLAPLRDTIARSLGEHSRLDAQVLEQVDRLSAELHAPLIGNLRTRRLHPQLELLRISSFLRSHAFLPKGYSTRALAASANLLSLRPLLPALPEFAHGTLKAEHLLLCDSTHVLCDFDHSGYFCGPVDVAHWVWDYYLQTAGSHPAAMLRCLAEETEDEDDLYLGICWILAFQLNRDLAYLSRGSRAQLHATLTFLYELGEAVRDVLPIH
jgi:Glycosyl transferases group 1